MQEGVRCDKFLAGLTITFFNTADTSVTAVPWVYQFYLVTFLFFVCFFLFFLAFLLACFFVRQVTRSFPFLYATLQMPTWQPVLLCEVLDCTQWARKQPHGLVCLLLYKVGKYLGPVSCFSGSNAGQKKMEALPALARSQCSIRTDHVFTQGMQHKQTSGPQTVSYIAKTLNHPSSSSELLG